MILYSYDHCPYCVKARMIFGLKGVSFEHKILLNDDEETPISMIGQKMLPILQKEDGSYLPESMDIVQYIDKLGEAEVKPSREYLPLNQWLAGARNYHYRLAMPRWPKMPIEEFATESAQAYFTKKKEAGIGPFPEHVKKTQEYIQMSKEHLMVLENMIVGTPYFWGEELTEDDFHVFATLRVMTTTKGVEFPPKVNAYMNDMSQRTGVPLHWDIALGEDF